MLAYTYAEGPKTNKQKKTAQTPAYDKLPFDSTREDLPKVYRGHDANALFKALLKMPVKDTYETTEHFKERFN
jgi:hypothetical protein